MASELPLLRATTLAEWRAWLMENSQVRTEIWLVFAKVHSGLPSLRYEEAVEEALCHGWIDSLVKRLDGDFYAQKFTPRKPGSRWSESNRRRVRRLAREGRMTPQGLRLVDFPLEEEQPTAPLEPTELVLDEPLQSLLEANRQAWDHFNALAPSYRRLYVRWVMDAKKEATRLRRMQEAIDLLAEGKVLGLK